jgi:hypothetical protein
LRHRSEKRKRGNKKIEKLIVIAVLFAVALPLDAQETGIRDNSFLIEEAYNQERGVVQHILTNRTAWDADGLAGPETKFEFTQEWPLWGEQVQGSYTLPLVTPFAGANIHVRYQLLNERADEFSVAPRFSLLWEYDSDLLFKDMLGYQVNLPISKEFDAKRIGHANIGATYRQDREWIYHVGASGIYAWRPTLHLMLEALNSTQKNAPPESVVNPGARYAVNTEGGTQWVFGVSIPVVVRAGVSDYGFFLYMSLEHNYFR